MAEARRLRIIGVIVLAALAALLALGTWQLERRAWKADLIANLEAKLALPPASLADILADDNGEEYRGIEYRPVRVTGRFRHDQEFYHAARSYKGQNGFHVVTPLLLDNAPGGIDAVLIDRGWVPADRQSPASRAAGLVTDTVTVTGIVRRPVKPNWFTPDNQPERNQWYWADVPAMTAALNERAGIDQVAPLLIEAGPAANPGGLPIGGQTRVELPNNHLQYAATWYALAATLAVIYLIWRRRNRASARSSE
jgi:surfeit locus 1 family protein